MWFIKGLGRICEVTSWLIRMKGDVCRNMWWDVISPFGCRRCLWQQHIAESHSSSSCFHLRCTGNAKLQFYGNDAASHAVLLHYGCESSSVLDATSRTQSCCARLMNMAEESFGPSNLLHKSRGSYAPYFPGFPHLLGHSVLQQIITGYSRKWSYSHISLIKWAFPPTHRVQ